MTAALVKLMWLEAIAYWGDMLIAGVVSVVLWHWLVKGWKAVVNWAWDLKDI